MAKVKKYGMKGKGKKMSGGSFFPAGDYVMKIVKNEITKSSNNDDMLKLELEVLEGEYKGRKFFENLLLENDNPQAVEISTNKLFTISLACGFEDTPDDIDELENLPMLVTLIEKEPSKQAKKKAKKDGKEARPQNQSVAFEPANMDKTEKKKDKKKDKGEEKPPWKDEEKKDKKKDKKKKDKK